MLPVNHIVLRWSCMSRRAAMQHLLLRAMFCHCTLACMSLACLLIVLSPFHFPLLFGDVFVAYCHDFLACACVCLFVAGADLARVSWHHAFCMVVKSAT